MTFERCDYSVNETNSQVQIFLILTSPLSTDTTVRVTDSYTTAIGELFIYSYYKNLMYVTIHTYIPYLLIC